MWSPVTPIAGADNSRMEDERVAVEAGAEAHMR